jgi:hypothetical protein
MSTPKQDSSLESVKEARRKWYYTVGTIDCSYLREPVKFNKHGFRHALTDGRDRYRGKKDALMRLHLLRWAPVVVKNSVHMVSSELRKADDPRNRAGKDVTFFELQHVCKGGNPKRPKYHDVTVILRRVGDGDLHYYSIRYTKNGYRGPED